MASAKPVIVVVHATSKQGTSVVNSLLQTRQFAVKALVRDETTESAFNAHLRTLIAPVPSRYCAASAQS